MSSVIALDQFTKYLIVLFVPENTIAWSWGAGFLGSDFFRLIHVRNTGVAFAFGDNFPETIRTVFFVLLPLFLISYFLYLIFFYKNLSYLHKIFIAGIVSGGFGNIIDRIFRSTGVVDFLDFKFYNILGLTRFPSFNVADMAAFVFTFILIFHSIFFSSHSKPS